MHPYMQRLGLRARRGVVELRLPARRPLQRGDRRPLRRTEEGRASSEPSSWITCTGTTTSGSTRRWATCRRSSSGRWAVPPGIVQIGDANPYSACIRFSAKPVHANSRRTQGQSGTVSTTPTSPLLGNSSAKAASSDIPSTSSQETPPPSQPRAVQDAVLRDVDGAGDSVPRKPIHRPQPQDLPGPNPSRSAKPPHSLDLMAVPA